MRFISRMALAAGALVGILAAPALAQFDTAHNHLKCYSIRGKPIRTKYQLDNQFGRELVVSLRPVLLCLPTQKTCCDPVAAVAGCQPVPCPLGNNPATPQIPVHHFKCYAIGVKQCTAADTICATATPKVPRGIVVNLFDQLHDELNVAVGRPKLLCMPVTKVRVDQTTSTVTSTTETTTSSTTTTQPCHNVAPTGQAPMCAGTCPPGSGLECVFIPASGQCTCEIACALTGPAPQQCNNQFCPNATQHCQPTAANPCGCCGLPTAQCTVGADCCSGTCMTNQCQ